VTGTRTCRSSHHKCFLPTKPDRKADKCHAPIAIGIQCLGSLKPPQLRPRGYSTKKTFRKNFRKISCLQIRRFAICDLAVSNKITIFFLHNYSILELHTESTLLTQSRCCWVRRLLYLQHYVMTGAFLFVYPVVRYVPEKGSCVNSVSGSVKAARRENNNTSLIKWVQTCVYLSVTSLAIVSGI
jgi:hypothetical protein